MALLDLKTDLKSLKYGRDTPGGGDSGQPYIQANIPTGDTTSVPFDDGFIRGGAVSAARASIADLKRISSFFKSKPHGTLFVARQVGLQLSNPRPEVRQNNTDLTFISTNRGLSPGEKQAGFEDIGATRIYNLGLNTLAQVPVNAFGVHFYRHGLLPVFGDAAKYEAVATANNQGENGKFNKLVRIADKFMLGDLRSNSNANVFRGELNTEFLPLEDARRLSRTERRVLRRDLRTTIRPYLLSQINPNGTFSRAESRERALSAFPRIDSTTLIVDRYIGGPGSVYGVGETIIPRRSNTEDKFKIENAFEQANFFGGKAKDKNGDPIGLDYSVALGNLSDYDDQITPTPEDLVISTNLNAVPYSFPSTSPAARYAQLRNIIQDNNTNGNYSIYQYTVGTEGLGQNPSTILPSGIKIPNYTSDNGTVLTIKLPFREATREINVGSANQDQINLTPLFTHSPGSINAKKINIPLIGTRTINDFVHFRIQALIGTNPTGNATWMIFRAYLTQFSDNVDAKWNSINYTGRGEDFYIYGGYSRKINIGFKVAALSEIEMQPIYEKLNYLMGNLMPDYVASGDGSVLMRGPFVKMTVGNWLDGQDGILNSLSYTVPQESPWEISLDNDIYGETLILPHIVEVQMTFTPIGSQTKGKNFISSKSTNTSHIAQNIGNKQYIRTTTPAGSAVTLLKPPPSQAYSSNLPSVQQYFIPPFIPPNYNPPKPPGLNPNFNPPNTPTKGMLNRVFSRFKNPEAPTSAPDLLAPDFGIFGG
jgi:hypothetical protein